MLDTEPAYLGIKAQLETIPDVTVLETEDDNQVEFVGDVVKPYIVLSMGGPIRAARGRGIVGSARDTNVVWVNVFCVSGNAGVSRKMKSAVVEKLVDFVPYDAGRLTLEGGQVFDVASTTTMPTRYVSSTMFTFRHNLRND